jgi:hypothetical protein
MSRIPTGPHATDILKDEYRVIEQVLDCLEELAGRAQTSGRLDGQSARQALDFFQNFADGYHRAKEEHHLFRLMEARGFPSGPPVLYLSVFWLLPCRADFICSSRTSVRGWPRAEHFSQNSTRNPVVGH